MTLGNRNEEQEKCVEKEGASIQGCVVELSLQGQLSSILLGLSKESHRTCFRIVIPRDGEGSM